MPSDVKENIELLAKNLQVIRDEINAPIRVHSGYRSPEHNIAVGGARNSFHIKGMAADISSASVFPSDLAELIEYLMDEGRIEKGGIGVYKTFVHYDIRGFKVKF